MPGRRPPVELVVGLDTFQPISEADPLDHRMHSERYRVPERPGRRARRPALVAVGTTSVRALESAAATGDWRAHRAVPRPRVDFQVVDVLMTNFHLPARRC